jgi:hypothetical protein
MHEWESWAEIIGSTRNLPMIFRDAIPQEGTFPYTVFSPVHNWDGEHGRPKLLCLYPGTLSIFESGALGQIDRTDYNFDSIERIVHGTIFLYSWIELHGLVDGNERISTIKYNSVAARVFDPILLALRHSSARQIDVAKLPASKAEFEFLRSLNLKFYRYGPMAVLPEESVGRVLYQPCLRTRVLGFIPCTLIPDQIVILTDQEVISMRDGGFTRAEGGGHDSYGVVTSFIPLRAVRDATLTESHRPDLKQLSIILSHDAVQLSFEARLEEDLLSFQYAILKEARG